MRRERRDDLGEPMSQRPTPAMTIEEAYGRLTAPGAPFEIIVEQVFGEEERVFKNRPPHLRHRKDVRSNCHR